MRILHDFNIICDMFSDVIKDDFLKHLRKSVIFNKDVGLK